MLRHRLELVLGPAGDGVDIAVIVAHEIQLAGGDRNRLGADAKEAADVDDNLAAMQMIDRTDLLIAGAIDGCAFEYLRR